MGRLDAILRRQNEYVTRPRRTLDEYEKVMSDSNGSCVICGKTKDRKHMAIDHCHQSGKLRGYLCRKCNSGLGFFDDNPELLRLAAYYLEFHKETT